jgi:hypothetical protein
MAKIVRLKESELVKLIQKTIVEQAKKNNLQEMFFGTPWLTKVTIDAKRDYSHEEKMKMVKSVCSGMIGPCAVGFGNGEWYNHFGEQIDDIDAYESKIENEDFGSDAYKGFREKFKPKGDMYPGMSDYVQRDM